MQNTTDLIRRALTHDPEALAALYDAFSEYSKGFAYQKLRNHHDAEDVAQTTWIRVLTSLQQFRGTGKFSTWLGTIILNECRNIHKKSKRSRTISLDGEPEGRRKREAWATHRSDFLETDTEHRAMLRDLQRNIQLLPSVFRNILVLRYVKGRSISQIAEELKISLPAAKSRLSRARSELATRFNRVM